MKFLVTGGAGFIGSHIVDRLLYMGHKVVVVDNMSSDGHDNYYWNSSAENHIVDITNFSELTSACNDIDCIYHLAAKASVQASINNPINTMQTQVMGTLNVLEVARHSGVNKVIYSSTSACYGNKNSIPNNELMREDPLNPYAIGKLSGEQLVKSYCGLHGMKTVALRYTNVYGERSRHVGTYAPAVGKFLKMKKNNEPLTIFGNGSQRRDFIHVSDVVSANMMFSFDEQTHWGNVYNIGYGKNWSIQEIADAISDNQIHLPAKSGEMKETLADITKAKQELQWEPKVNILEWIKTQL